MSLRRRYIILMFAGAGLCVWAPRHLELQRIEGATKAAREEIAVLARSIDEAEQNLRRERAQLEIEDAERRAAIARLEHVKQEAGKQPLAPVWNNPPAQWPSWEPASPYIWIPKEGLPQMRPTPFTSKGRLTAEVIEALALKPEEVSGLNTRLESMLQQYQQLETSRAYLTNNHLPGVSHQKGEMLTLHIEPMPEQAAVLKQQFHADLRSALGEQRAALVTSWGEQWIGSKFANFGEGARTITVVQDPERKTYGIALQAPNDWRSMGGMRELDRFVPSHLLHFFAPLMKETPESVR